MANPIKANKMVNVKLSNAKFVESALRIIMEKARLGYEQLKNILILYGSERKPWKYIPIDV